VNQHASDMVLVFPNPFNDILNVYIPVSLSSQQRIVVLKDDLGRDIRTYIMESSTNSLNLSDLSKGMYFLTLFVDAEPFQTVKLVK
jgi:hypothetical protein